MNPNKATPSRREVVAKGTGMLAVPLVMAVGSVANAEEHAPAASASALPMQDPLQQYPKPP